MNEPGLELQTLECCVQDCDGIIELEGGWVMIEELAPDLGWRRYGPAGHRPIWLCPATHASSVRIIT